MNADLGTQLDKLMGDAGGLAEFLRQLTADDRKLVFQDLRARLSQQEGGKEAKNKLTLTPEILQANSQNLNPDPGSEPLSLGVAMLGKDQLEVLRSFKSDTRKINTLNYCINNPEKIGTSSLGKISWYWGDGEAPYSQHREVKDKNYRGNGLGEALLALSEDSFRQLGFFEARVGTSVPATASWFFHQGYFPEEASDLKVEFLQAILNRATNYDKTSEHRVTLKKVLNRDK